MLTYRFAMFDLRAMAPWLVFGLGTVMFGIRSVHGLYFLPFPDETMALLGGWVINSGGLLYRDFVDNHGPLLFILTAAYGWSGGWAISNFARLIPVIWALLAGAAVGFSPLLSGREARLWGVGLFLGLLGSVWLVQGLYLVNYYSISGAQSVILLALFVVPIWCERSVSPTTAMLAGLVGGALGFTCYCFMPTVALFGASGLLIAVARRQCVPIIWFIAGGVIASAAVLLWMAIWGDIRGYLAFHIAFSQTAYSSYILFGWRTFVSSLDPSLGPAELVHSIALIAFFSGTILALGLSIGTHSHNRAVRAGACLLGAGGSLLLNARGATIFQDGTFVMAAFGLLALILPAMVERFSQRPRGLISVARPFGGIVATVCFLCLLVVTEMAARNAISTPGRMTRAVMKVQPRYKIASRVDGPMETRIRQIVRPGEKFLALVFKPELYWAADRLPISGFYEYLPWDATYAAEQPWFGRPRDLCATLDTSPPVLIYFDNWKVWDRYAPADYMPCVLRVLDGRYRRSEAFPELYIRSDRYDGG
jgi:hypothetical protein